MVRLARVVLVAGLVGSLAAAGARGQAAGEGTPARISRADLDAFVDGVVEPWLERSDVAGAVVAVIADREIALLKGYGFADVAKQTPVDAERTLFRPGSISKLFVALAVMQLVEQGKLDLDADVNGYIDFELPIAAGRPVTLRQLLTHRAGFEEQNPRSRQRQREPAAPRRVPARASPAPLVPRRAVAVLLELRLHARWLRRGARQRRAASRSTSPDTCSRRSGWRTRRSREPLPETLAPRMSRGYLAASSEAEPLRGHERRSGGRALRQRAGTWRASCGRCWRAESSTARACSRRRRSRAGWSRR